MNKLSNKKIKIDIGCGKHKINEFISVGINKDGDVDIVIPDFDLPF